MEYTFKIENQLIRELYNNIDSRSYRIIDNYAAQITKYYIGR